MGEIGKNSRYNKQNRTKQCSVGGSIYSANHPSLTDYVATISQVYLIVSYCTFDVRLFLDTNVGVYVVSDFKLNSTKDPSSRLFVAIDSQI